MELVVYGCGNEEHSEENDCEYFNLCLKSKEKSLALGFDVKQPPICSYCHQIITKIVKENNNIEKLTLAFMTNMPRVFMTDLYDSILTNSSIQSLNIRWADIGLLDEKMISFVGEVRSREINYKFDACRIDDARGEKIIKQLSNNTNIENFYLSMNGNMVGEKSLIQLKNVFEVNGHQMKNVQISMRNNEVNDYNSKYVGEALGFLKQVETISLNFDECVFDSESILNITGTLPKKLQKFSFSYEENMIGDAQLQQFSDSMDFAVNELTELDFNFSQNEFGDDGIIYLSNKIGQFINLKVLTLHLRRNSISNEGMEGLFNNLSKLTKLENLQLNISGLFDEQEMIGIDTFLQSAVSLKKLALNMQDNNINSKGIESLCKGIQNNRNIRDLQLNFFYGNVENVYKLYIVVIEEMLKHKRNFGELDIIIDKSTSEITQSLSQLLNDLCLDNFEKMIQLIQLSKILDNPKSMKDYLLDLSN